MQALYKLALAPVAETIAYGDSYGFQEGLSCADAIQAGFNALNKPNSATGVWEADITGCYDNIPLEWLFAKIPMDKTILRMWLEAGYVENVITYPSRKGTPQGGIISPTLANMTLDGLEEVVRSAVPHRKRVNFIRYADDFIVTGKSKRLLEERIKPAVEKFLGERGLRKVWPETAHQAIKRGSPRPHPKVGNDNLKIRQRPDVGLNQEAESNASGLGKLPPPCGGSGGLQPH